MKFGIITHCAHKIHEEQFFAYEPYVREMDLWGKYVDEIIIIAPVSNQVLNEIEIPYKHQNIKIVQIPDFDVTTFKNCIKAIFLIPIICVRITNVMREVDHIHLRSPGNVGLLGCVLQIFFPKKKKTAKYAGNWDFKSKQPFTYSLQKRILKNTWLTKNIKVLVYGNWPKQSENIVPFFTASYRQSEIIEVPSKDFKECIKLIYVGALTKSKQPILSVKTTQALLKRGYDVVLDIYGDGLERKGLENYVSLNKLENKILFHGNVSKDVVKKAFKSSHFLIFISKSEGWPKVVAEAMFWSCLPIASSVSCVPFMLDYGNRGALVSNNLNEIVQKIESYLQNEDKFRNQVEEGKKWSQFYTLEKFEKEISKFI